MLTEAKSRAELIRWTLEMAAKEFGLNPRTVSGRVRQSGITPGEDGLFSTVDIHRALCPDVEIELNAERLRKTKAESERIELENEKTRGTLVSVEATYKHFEHFFVALRARILASGLTEDEKDELLKDLRGIKARDLSTNAS